MTIALMAKLRANRGSITDAMPMKKDSNNNRDDTEATMDAEDEEFATDLVINTNNRSGNSSVASSNSSSSSSRRNDAYANALCELQHELREKIEQIEILRNTLATMSVTIRRQEQHLKDVTTQVDEKAFLLEEKIKECNEWKHKYEEAVNSGDRYFNDDASVSICHREFNMSFNHASNPLDPLLGARNDDDKHHPWKKNKVVSSQQQEVISPVNPIVVHDITDDLFDNSKESNSGTTTSSSNESNSDDEDEDSITNAYGDNLDDSMDIAVRPIIRSNRVRPYKPKKPIRTTSLMQDLQTMLVLDEESEKKVVHEEQIEEMVDEYQPEEVVVVDSDDKVSEENIEDEDEEDTSEDAAEDAEEDTEVILDEFVSAYLQSNKTEDNKDMMENEEEEEENVVKHDENNNMEVDIIKADIDEFFHRQSTRQLMMLDENVIDDIADSSDDEECDSPIPEEVVFDSSVNENDNDNVSSASDDSDSDDYTSSSESDNGWSDSESEKDDEMDVKDNDKEEEEKKEEPCEIQFNPIVPPTNVNNSPKTTMVIPTDDDEEKIVEAETMIATPQMNEIELKQFKKRQSRILRMAKREAKRASFTIEKIEC